MKNLLLVSLMFLIACAQNKDNGEGTPSNNSNTNNPVYRSGLPWRSGVSPGTSDGADTITNINGFATWRGHPVDIAALFIGQNSWQVGYSQYLSNEVLSDHGGVKAVLDAGVAPLLTVPLVILSDAGKFNFVANGGIDAEHQAIANKILSVVGSRTIYLRLGHEADSGYPWSYTNHGSSTEPDPAIPADYRAAWSRIAKIYKSTIPGAKLVWNVLKNTREKISSYYPGDDVVDILSVDVYDNGYGGYCDSSSSKGWITTCLGAYDAVNDISKGVAGLLSFAKIHGKKIGVDEWGSTNEDLAPANGANNSFFVQGMYDFFKANASAIEYESYFNRSGGGRHQIWPKTTYNPLPSDNYLSKWTSQ